MKSRMKPALRAVPTAQVQISLPVQGVLQDVRHAFYGLCVQAGQQVLAAMMEATAWRCAAPRACPMARVARCAAAAREAASC